MFEQVKKTNNNIEYEHYAREGVDDVCKLILDANNAKDRGVGMNTLFVNYRYALSKEGAMIMTSGIEDVIYKILNDANESRSMDKYMPFVRFVSVINERYVITKSRTGFMEKCLLLSETWSNNRKELDKLIKDIFKIEIKEI